MEDTGAVSALCDHVPSWTELALALALAAGWAGGFSRPPSSGAQVPCSISEAAAELAPLPLFSPCVLRFHLGAGEKSLDINRRSQTARCESHEESRVGNDWVKQGDLRLEFPLVGLGFGSQRFDHVVQ